MNEWILLMILQKRPGLSDKNESPNSGQKTMP